LNVLLSRQQVVNLVSNDVRRFDESMPFWIFLWAGPLELAFVVLMISLEVGPAAAFAGIAALLALVPLQVDDCTCTAFRHSGSPADGNVVSG
jgi:ATP-binding cassette subfamily C (CFTR/MRP) protein 4